MESERGDKGVTKRQLFTGLHRGAALLLFLLLCCPALADEHPVTHKPGEDYAPHRVGIGDEAPPLVGMAANGDAVDLAELRGQPVVLVFYMASTCAGCLKYLVELGQSAEKFTEQGARIIAVSSDHTTGIKRTLAHLAQREVGAIAVWGDPTLEAIEAWGVKMPKAKQSFHSIFLLDEEGVIRFVARGDAAPMNLPSPVILLSELKGM